MKNLKNAIEVAKKMDLWVLGTSEHRGESLYQIEQDRSWLVIVGNEEKGIRPLTEKSCDFLCQIPKPNAELGIGSLNVSVASGILLSHFARIH